ncbi:MAG: hypothetical protein JXA44_00555 [Methanospirillaceae archaeon]|nr:hypothetical protein [Methanospirillaceae archaeon]
MIDPTKLSFPKRKAPKIDVIFAILLLIATLSSAFCVYQATRWNGIQAIDFGNSATFRTESLKAATLANTQTIIDVQAFTSWVDAVSNHDEKRALFLKERFRDEFKPAFEVWISEAEGESGLIIPEGTPFDLTQYHIANSYKSKELEDKAAMAFLNAKNDNENGDQYIFNTVLFAIVLFFCGIYSKWETPRIRIALLAVTLVVFCFALYNLLSLLFRLGIV